MNSLRNRSALHFIAMLALLATVLSSDTWSRSDPVGPPRLRAEFEFVRLSYANNTMLFGGRDRWLTDWPDAEHHLMRGVRRLTRIDADQEGR